VSGIGDYHHRARKRGQRGLSRKAGGSILSSRRGSILASAEEFDSPEATDPSEYTTNLTREVQHWLELSDRESTSLDLYRIGQSVLITDTRPIAVRPFHFLDGLEAQVYLLCDSARPLAGLTRKLGDSIGVDQINSVLESFRRAHLMVEMDGQYLSLAVFRNRSLPTYEDSARDSA